ncbi:HepT-like ribonuclease domain-containing protein [Shinella granuli]|uniref:HepT-like ribonuclease domain-containing protein n=1 Tax=Shinella granuli TaxID=323621 RepID=UPI001FDF8176|nr:HepT-like ribonuclease domain-containing protein [Shinella granuli]
MPTERPKTRLQDIVENATSILTYTTGMDREAFARNNLVRDAVERCLEWISEAASKLGGTAETLLPNHPWRQIRDLGNILRHAYDNVDEEIVWSIVTERLPTLIIDAERAAVQLPDDT